MAGGHSPVQALAGRFVEAAVADIRRLGLDLLRMVARQGDRPSGTGRPTRDSTIPRGAAGPDPA